MQSTTNRISRLFNEKKGQVLNVYFTAGFPQLRDTVTILETLQEAGVDLIEIGMPYSDPVADGETIQASNQVALENGMTIRLLLEQLQGIRQKVTVPILLMGYLNPVMQYGMERFCQACQQIGIDGLILPDMPLAEYQEEYKPLFDRYGLFNIFLITPQTSEARIRLIDEISDGFIYMVSSASVTGATSGISEQQEAYFKRIQAMNLRNPRLIGFGISNHETFTRASQYAQGAIIGSAFIKVLQKATDLKRDITDFVTSVKREEGVVSL
jgi:tryptophan synthase alpha chain